MDFILLEQKIPVAKTNILNMINEKGDTIYIVYDSYCHAFIDGFWTCTFDKINLQNLSKKCFCQWSPSNLVTRMLTVAILLAMTKYMKSILKGSYC